MSDTKTFDEIPSVVKNEIEFTPPFRLRIGIFESRDWQIIKTPLVITSLEMAARVEFSNEKKQLI